MALGVVCGFLVLANRPCGTGNGITPIRTLFNRGVYHLWHGDYDEAIAEFVAAVEEDPDDFRARFNLAVVFEEKASSTSSASARAELLKAGEAEYRELLRRRPDDVPAQVNLASCLYDQGKPDDAEALLRQATEKYADAVLPLYALAGHLLKENRVEAALVFLDKAHALDPAHLGVNTLLGVTHAHLAATALPEAAEARSTHIEAVRAAYTAALRRRSDDIAVLVQ